ncbi:hypothetical protein [Arthrobacter sp. FW306-2-2C-D06B]|nr:hypothetical protein [Arthrobacter sp. FW306-2-2C-D06B]UKA60607.1 hypothetical protein LFT47_09875 [Arthrobacter sp. FW306-2-2C-D06B]
MNEACGVARSDESAVDHMLGAGRGVRAATQPGRKVLGADVEDKFVKGS